MLAGANMVRAGKARMEREPVVDALHVELVGQQLHQRAINNGALMHGQSGDARIYTLAERYVVSLSLQAGLWCFVRIPDRR